jgi:hypothetical protein
VCGGGSDPKEIEIKRVLMVVGLNAGGHRLPPAADPDARPERLADADD